jgi:hypothetical protein
MVRKTPVFARRIGRRRSRVRVRMIVYAVFALLVLAASLAGLAVNKHIEQVWEQHLRWLEGQTP